MVAVTGSINEKRMEDLRYARKRCDGNAAGEAGSYPWVSRMMMSLSRQIVTLQFAHPAEGAARICAVLCSAVPLAVLLVQPVLACSFDISFNSQFEGGKDHLPASEVRRMAEWMIDKPRKYENQQEFHIALYQSPGAGISHALARKRVVQLQSLLKMFGVPAGKISSEIAPYRPGKSGLPPNFVQVDFLPGCPHPCCPGMEPIRKAP